MTATTLGLAIGTALLPATAAVANVHPDIPEVVVPAGGMRAGAVLTGRYVGRVNDPGEPYAVKGIWVRCRPNSGSCTGLTYYPPGGPTLPAEYDDLTYPYVSTYAVEPGDIGFEIAYKVLAHNESISEMKSSNRVWANGVPADWAGIIQVTGTPRDGEVLRATNYADPIGTPPFITAFVWERCDASGAGCVEIEPVLSVQRTASAADVGHTLRITAQATNSFGSGTISSAPTPVIAPITTTNTTVPTLSGTALDGGQLTADPGTWKGTVPVAVRYLWRQCDGTGASCVTRPETSSSLALSPADIGSTFRILATASGPGGTATEASQPSAVVAARAPSPDAAPWVTGDPVEGETLSAHAGSWSGTPPIAHRHEWFACDDAGGHCTTIAGATASTLLLTPELIGSRITARVTATGPGGTDLATTAATATVQGRAPINTTAPRVDDTGADATEPAPAGSGVALAIRPGRLLSVSDGSWAGTTTLTLTTQWERCGGTTVSCSPIAGAVRRSYAPENADVGFTIRARITAENVAGRAVAFTEPVLVLAADTPIDIPPRNGEPVRASAILSLTRPTTSCRRQLRERLTANGPLRLSGTLPGHATVTAGKAPVLTLTGGRDTLTIRTATGRLLGVARGIGDASIVKRTAARISVRSPSRKVLVAIGRQHATVVVKGRVCATSRSSARTIAARADRATSARLYLLADTGAPLVNATIEIVDGDRHAAVRTDSNGLAQLRLQHDRGSRAVTAVFAGDRAHAPATIAITIGVKSTTTLTGHVSSADARLRGQVTGAAGARVRVHYLDSKKRWVQLGETTSAGNGRWTLSARTPSRHAGSTQLVLRAVVEKRGAFYARTGNEVRINVVAGHDRSAPVQAGSRR